MKTVGQAPRNGLKTRLACIRIAGRRDSRPDTIIYVALRPGEASTASRLIVVIEGASRCPGTYRFSDLP